MPAHEHATTCPWCGRENKLVRNADGHVEEPKEGDWTICWRCHGLGFFTADGSIREATTAELVEMSSDPELREVLGNMLLSDTPRETEQRAHRKEN